MTGKIPLAWRDFLPPLPKPDLLYMAGLYHDIARRAAASDHSELLGAVDAIRGSASGHQVARLGYAILVSWLVRTVI